MLVGVILISGVLEHGAYGKNPALGAVFGVLTGLAYTAFLLALRQGGRGIVGPAGPLFDATLAAAIGCALIGLVVGDLDLTPSLAAQGWLDPARAQLAGARLAADHDLAAAAAGRRDVGLADAAARLLGDLRGARS